MRWFEPVLKPTTIRTVLYIAFGQGWQIKELYVKNTFHLRHSFSWMKCARETGIPRLYGLTSSFYIKTLTRASTESQSNWGEMSVSFARRFRCFRVKIEDLQTAELAYIRCQTWRVLFEMRNHLYLTRLKQCPKTPMSFLVGPIQPAISVFLNWESKKMILFFPFQ